RECPPSIARQRRATTKREIQNHVRRRCPSEKTEQQSLRKRPERAPRRPARRAGLSTDGLSLGAASFRLLDCNRNPAARVSGRDVALAWHRNVPWSLRLVVAEGDQRVDLGGAAGRDEAGEQRDKK